MTELRYYDSEFSQVEAGAAEWASVEFDCAQCGAVVARWRGVDYGGGILSCVECGACYNTAGQRLRDNCRSNPSNYDDEIGDMEGYEIACIREENGL